MPIIHSESLKAFVRQIFQAAGATASDAELVANSLVTTNLTGHDSHGIIRVQQYLTAITNNEIVPTNQPKVDHDVGAITTIDAQLSFGQVAASFAMHLTIDKAHKHGLAATTITNCNHIGRVGEWVEMAAAENLIGLAFCNGGRAGGLVAPHNGAARRLGTNPIAAAVPIGDGPPFVLDFATSIVAEGKVRVALNEGKSLPEGWILDKAGHPSTTPQDLYDEGMLLPAAGYKGYGLSLLTELLGGVLSGQGNATLFDFAGVRNGVLFIVLSIELFRPIDEFLGHSQRLQEAMKQTPPGSEADEVMLPGEPERLTAARRNVEGIPIPEAIWAQLVEAAKNLKIPIPLLKSTNSFEVTKNERI